LLNRFEEVLPLTLPAGLALAERTILVLGSPRSGTTWLAKLLDSHPDVLYRHEPDEVLPPDPSVDPHVQLRAWVHERRLRVSATPPFFPKSWRPPPLAVLRIGMAQGLKALSHLTRGRRIGATVALPDLIPIERRPRLRPVIKLVDWDADDALRAIPGCRGLFILRHPCGQVASAMRGAEQRRFEPRPDGSFGPVGEHSAAALAASRGIDAAAFRALPTAARFAWVWRSFNEPALARIVSLPNIRLVLYEQLCAEPEAVTRELFRFVGLDWQSQTERFIARSTQDDSDPGYYAVFRSTHAAVERWRRTMTPADQDAVRMVVRDSPLAHHWPGLCR
jgi:LPS sulfotransferase NodH